MKHLAIISLILLFLLLAAVAAQQVERAQVVGECRVVELHASADVSPLFTITGIDLSPNDAVVWIEVDDPAALLSLLAAGRLRGEISDAAGAVTPVALQLWHTCACGDGVRAEPYDAARPCGSLCAEEAPAERFYLLVAGALPPGGALALADEPYSLWFVEKE